MTKIKLWISDIDGTLINYDSTMTDRMKNLINKLNKIDFKLVLSTGRMFQGAKFAADNFNLKTPVVCYQGAVVRTKDEVLWRVFVKENLAREVIGFLKERKIHTHVYNNDILWVEDDNKKIMHEYCYNRGTTYSVIDNFDKLDLSSGCEKLLAVIYDQKLMAEIKEELAKKYKGILNIVQSSKMYLEITDKEASKGAALNFLKKYWNLSDEEVIASGDQDNDIELLKNAHYKVCVGKNSEKLAQIANYHCNSVNSDELVDLVEELILSWELV